MAMCYWVKEYDKAIEYFTKAIEVDPEYDRAYLDRALLYNRLSRRAAWTGVTAEFSDEECRRFSELSHKDYDMAEAIGRKRGDNTKYARDQ
jgi:tetratricopeptide (TPR) repeat protein